MGEATGDLSGGTSLYHADERPLSWAWRPAIQVKFSAAACRACPIQARCTRAKSGVRTIAPRSRRFRQPENGYIRRNSA
ncbi:transposase [Deinococcus sp. UYEF24]